MNEFVNMLKESNGYISLGGATEEEIQSAEENLQVSFSDEYKEYLRECGVASTDEHEFTGITKSKRLNVVSATRRFKKTCQDLADKFYVVESLGIDGAAVLQDKSGRVYFTAIGFEKTLVIAESLAHYLMDGLESD